MRTSDLVGAWTGSDPEWARLVVQARMVALQAAVTRAAALNPGHPASGTDAVVGTAERFETWLLRDPDTERAERTGR